MVSKVEVKGDKEIAAILVAVGSMEPTKRGLATAARHIKAKIAQYPAATGANAPGRWSVKTHRPMGWYVRGRGAVSASGKQYYGSEQLGQKWTIEARDGGMTQVVGNNVSYGKWVQGKEQAMFHKMRGWKTDEQVAREEADTVTRMVRAENELALKG